MEVEACNKESGLHIQLITNESKAFAGAMARCGKFSGVQNHFALKGEACRRNAVIGVSGLYGRPG